MTAHAHNRRKVGRSPPIGEVRGRLEALLREVDRRALRAADPVELVHPYRDPHDQEVAGLLVAGLAYGRALSIRARAGVALAALGPSPAERLALAARSGRGALRSLDGFVYRFQRGEDVPRFLEALGRVRLKHGSLAAAFARARCPEDIDHADAAARFVGEIRGAIDGPLTYGLRYLLPDPSTGGASKRLLLYLRWMIRGPDGLDLGTWRHLSAGLDPSGLVIPIDTHISRIARYLGLTRRAVDDLVTAREITRALAELDPSDPVRYDMALCHLGISGACPREQDPRKCGVCPLRSICRARADRV